MGKRSITVRIDRVGFTHEEHFLSKVDAEHWREMMEQTLAMPKPAARAHGGPHAQMHCDTPRARMLELAGPDIAAPVLPGNPGVFFLWVSAGTFASASNLFAVCWMPVSTRAFA